MVLVLPLLQIKVQMVLTLYLLASPQTGAVAVVRGLTLTEPLGVLAVEQIVTTLLQRVPEQPDKGSPEEQEEILVLPSLVVVVVALAQLVKTIISPLTVALVSHLRLRVLRLLALVVVAVDTGVSRQPRAVLVAAVRGTRTPEPQEPLILVVVVVVLAPVLIQPVPEALVL